MFQHEHLAAVAAARRREAERPRTVLLSLFFLACFFGLFALSRPSLAPLAASGLGLDVASASLVSLVASLMCAALFFVSLFALVADIRAGPPPSMPVSAVSASSPAPLTPTAATKPMMPTPPKAPTAASARLVFSPSTPPVRSPLSVPLTDERQLNSYLQRAASISGMSSSPGGGGGGGASPMNLGLTRPSFSYQTSYRASGGATEDAGLLKETEAAKDVLQRLKIELAMHSEWPYRMRRWISSELVEKTIALADELKNRQNAVDRLARIEYENDEKQRKQQQLQQQQQGGGGWGWGGGTGNTGNSGNSGGWGWGTTAFSGTANDAWGGFGGTQATEEQNRKAALARAEEMVLKKHEQLQRCLDVTQDKACKEYVLDRLRQLADGGTLASYEWNGGGKFKGRDWSADSLPTDAQVIFHLFVTRLNTLLYQQAEESGMHVGHTPFSNRYLLITPQTPDPKNKDVLL